MARKGEAAESVASTVEPAPAESALVERAPVEYADVYARLTVLIVTTYRDLRGGGYL